MESVDDRSLQEIFARLKAILQLYAPEMVIVKDEPGNFYLDTVYRFKNRKSLFFGAVTIRKNYVSFHLFPLYTCPVLFESLSDGLKARMQGKSCFNFKKVDTELFEELAQLTQAGFERFQSAAFLEKVCGR
jgi:hypothetical protein